MSVKFRLGFTVEAETMFSLMAKLLPIEDLSVEELREPPRRVSFSPNTFAAPAPKLAKPHRLQAPKRARKGLPATGGGRFKAMMPAFANGPLTLPEMRAIMTDNGYSHNGLSSAVNQWIRFGLIEKTGQGTYRAKLP
jgi:hypothetical protein